MTDHRAGTCRRPGKLEVSGAPGSGRASVHLCSAVGDAAAWHALDVTLAVNGEQRQHVAARDCVYDPQRFHGEVFSDANGPEWSLVASGTGGGVIFRQPSFAGKLWLFVSSGFSVNGAKEKLLRKLDFLKPGDRITMQSSTLGQSSAIVSE